MRRSPLPHPQDRSSEVAALYHRNRLLDAWHTLAGAAGLERLSGAQELAWGGRILGNLFVPRAGRWCLLRANRLAPGDLEVASFAASVRTRWGPLRALAHLDSLQHLASPGDPWWSDLLMLRASVLAQLRDFSAAELLQDEAERLTPGRAWASVCRSRLLVAMDCRDEALKVVEQLRGSQEGFRPAIEQHVELLVEAAREDEALALLERVSASAQVPSFWTRRSQLEELLGRPDDAWRSIDQALSLIPWFEEQTFAWMSAIRSKLASRRGQWDLAITLGHHSGAPFHIARAARLEAAGASTRPRRVLPVPFVRQHHLTCAPATIAATAAYWQRPIDHLELAREITWDGTPGFAERQWLTDHGWVVREFTATTASVTALLDLGVPVHLYTQGTTNGHAQVIIGDEPRRGVFVVRDPTVPGDHELDAESGLAAFASSGPRAMVMLPSARASLLEGVTLPDAAVFDVKYDADRAIDGLRFEDAHVAMARLETLAPGHLQTLLTRASLANTEMDLTAALEAAQALCALHPDEPRFALALAERHGTLDDEPARLATLRRASMDPLAPSTVLHELATALAGNALHHAECERLLRKASVRGPTDGPLLLAWAGLRWRQGRRAEALPLYRFAACAKALSEPYAQTYFRAALAEGRADEALAHLESRYRAAAHRNAMPAVTFVEALRQMKLLSRAKSVLDEALAARPGDAELHLARATLALESGDLGTAEAAIKAAHGKVSPLHWHSVRASVFEARGALDEALSERRAVLALAPDWFDAQSEFLRVLTASEGQRAAADALARLLESAPSSKSLRVLEVQSLRSSLAPERLATINAFVEAYPDEVWGHCEQAIAMEELGQNEAILTAAERALAIAPEYAPAHALRGCALIRLGNREAGRAALMEGLSRDLDTTAALELLLAATTPEERPRTAEFLSGKLRRSPDPSLAVTRLRSAPHALMSPEALLSLIEELATARPAAMGLQLEAVAQLEALGRPEEALARAVAACDGPLGEHAASWVLQASQLRGAGQPERSRDVLLRAAVRWPEDLLVLQDLATTHERLHERREEQRVIERLLAAHPRRAVAHGFHADHLWKSGSRPQAWDAIVRTLELDPCYEWAWATLGAWSRELKQEPEAAQVARRIAAVHRDLQRPVRAIAEFLPDPTARLEVFDALLETDPSRLQFRLERAAALEELGRFEDAMSACSTPFEGTPDPVPLRGRRARLLWRMGQRDAAMAALRELNSDVPDYPFAVAALSSWSEELNRFDDAVRYARRLVDLDPREVWAHLRLGEALQANRDLAGAVQSFEHAVAMAPADPGTLLPLFEAYLTAGRKADAKQILERAEACTERGLWEVNAVKLALARRKHDEAKTHYAQVLLNAGDDPWLVDTATDALERAGKGDLVKASLRRAVRTGGASEAVVAHWAARVANDLFPLIRWLLLLRLSPQDRVSCQAELLTAWGNDRCPWFLPLLPFVQGASLQRETRTWAALGYALLRQQRMSLARWWMRTWRRPDALAWMLSNVIYATAAARPPEARAALTWALSVPHHEHRKDLVSWQAWFEARFGTAPGFQAAFEELDGPLGLSPIQHTNYTLGHAVALARGLVEPALTARERFDLIRKKFARADAKSGWAQGRDVNYGPLRRQALWHVRHVDGLRSLLWVLFKMLPLPP